MTQPIVVRLMSQRGAPNETLLKSHMPRGSLDQGDLRFTVEDERADVTIVLNYLKYDTEVSSRDGFVWCWHNEPIVRQPLPLGFDRFYSHLRTSDRRVMTAPPILDWWIGKSRDELINLSPPQKSQTASIIASVKEIVPGHRARNQFVSTIQRQVPEVKIYGAGRQFELEDKWDGLANYRYSIAVENTSKNDYWTEKIADCILSYTIPLYFGAPNIGEYLPEGSFIWLPLDSPEEAVKTVASTLSHDSWERRLPAIQEARELLLDKYSLFGQLSARVRAEADEIRNAPWKRRRIHGRRTRPGGWIREVGLAANLRNQSRRIQARLE